MICRKGLKNRAPGGVLALAEPAKQLHAGLAHGHLNVGTVAAIFADQGLAESIGLEPVSADPTWPMHGWRLGAGATSSSIAKAKHGTRIRPTPPCRNAERLPGPGRIRPGWIQPPTRRHSRCYWSLPRANKPVNALVQAAQAKVGPNWPRQTGAHYRIVFLGMAQPVGLGDEAIWACFIAFASVSEAGTEPVPAGPLTSHRQQWCRTGVNFGVHLSLRARRLFDTADSEGPCPQNLSPHPTTQELPI